jgi:hypothetical protein
MVHRSLDGPHGRVRRVYGFSEGLLTRRWTAGVWHALVKAGFTKTNPNAPGAASVAKSDPILYLHFVHRTVNGVPMVFYYDPIACKCVYSGTEA